MELFSNPSVPFLLITANAGKLALEGIAASADERHAIVEVVTQVARVKGVDNKLEVMKDVRIFSSSKT